MEKKIIVILINFKMLRNYFLEKSNNSISNIFNVQTLIKIYYLKVLKNVSEVLVGIFIILIDWFM
jgi:hypothetical protein